MRGLPIWRVVAILEWPFSRQFEGEMAEWSNAAVSKTVAQQLLGPGFESQSLRGFCFTKAKSALSIFCEGYR